MAASAGCRLVERFARAGALALVSGVVACSSLSGDPIAPGLRSETFCVERHAADSRDLASQIADALSQAGLQVVVADANCADRAPYRVTYADRWNWDIRMYLSRLTLEVSDAGTGEVVAMAESSQDSLSALGDTHREVIDRAVSTLLGTK